MKRKKNLWITQDVFLLANRRAAREEEIHAHGKSLADKLISSQIANAVLKDCVIARASTMKEGELESSGAYSVYGASGISWHIMFMK